MNKWLQVAIVSIISIMSVQAQDAVPNQTIKKICSLNSREANAIFEKNVAIMQRLRREAVELQTELDKASRRRKRRAQSKLDKAMKVLNESNQKMAKTYGYSILGNYGRKIRESKIYLVLTPEEQAKRQDGKQVIPVATLHTAESNERFGSNVRLMERQVKAAMQMKAKLDDAEPKMKKSIQAEADKVMAQLNENNRVMNKTYRFNIMRRYVKEITKSDLYLVMPAR